MLRGKHCRHPGVVDHLGSLLLHVISPKTYASNNVKILQIFQCFGCIWRWSLVSFHFQHSKNPFVNLASFVYQLRAFVSDVGTYSSFNKGFEMGINTIKSWKNMKGSDKKVKLSHTIDVLFNSEPIVENTKFNVKCRTLFEKAHEDKF